MHSIDFRQRAVVLFYIYSISAIDISRILGVCIKTINRWNADFERDGSFRKKRVQPPRERITQEQKTFIDEYAKYHPWFYIEELQSELKAR